MRRTVEIPLSVPVEWFDKTISNVRLEEPAAATLFELGDPQVIVHSAKGEGASIVDVPAVIQSYVEKCLRVENPGAFLLKLGLQDGRAIKRALLDFFRDAPAQTSG